LLLCFFSSSDLAEECGSQNCDPCVEAVCFTGVATLSIGEQQITSIINADAIRKVQLKKGQTAGALIKSAEVMIILP